MQLQQPYRYIFLRYVASRYVTWNSYKMKEWLKISCLLCVFGFVREIRPSEPYVTEYLLGPWRNITEDQVRDNTIIFSIHNWSLFL